MNKFYIALSPVGRLTHFGEFDPNHPRLHSEILVSEFARWAAKQPDGYQRLTVPVRGKIQTIEDGDHFWIGAAPSLQDAVKQCQANIRK